MISQPPPPMPWKKGEQKDYKCFVIEVRVCCGPDGDIWSIHEPQSPNDDKIAKSLDSFGENQTVHALLTETLRREAFWQILLSLEKDKRFVDRYKRLDDAKKEVIEQKLVTTCRQVIHNTTQKMMPNIVKEIMAMVSNTPGGSS